jgi:multiple sugar transport system permease protein
MMLPTRRAFGGLARHLILGFTGLFALLPFLWMVRLALGVPDPAVSGLSSLAPHHWAAAANFGKALGDVPMLRFLANGVVVCSSIVALQLCICLPAGYALAKLRFPGDRLLFGLVLVGLMVPQQALALPLFVMIARAHLLDTYAALILPFAVSPMAIFLFRQFVISVPQDILDAARLDGLSELSIIRRIILPVSAPAILSFGLFSVVTNWNGLFWPLIAVRSQELLPPSLGILMFRSTELGTDYGPLMAAAMLTIAPLVTMFLFAQRGFIQGLTSGAIK